jgi:hypothetical protein
MKESSELIPLIFRAIALAMSVASVVLSILNVAPVQVHIILLGLGLFALSVAAMHKTRQGS